MEKIGFKEAGRLFTILIISTVTLDSVGGFVRNSGTAAFINALLGMTFAVAVVLISRNVFINSDLEGVFKDVYGSFLGNVLMAVLLVLTVLNASSRMNICADAVGEYVLRESPRIFILLLFSVCVFAAAYFGIESLTRYSLAAFVVFVLFSLIILVSSVGEVRFLNLCPILGKGSFMNAANMLYVFSDIVYMYFIIGSIREKKKLKGSMLKPVITGGTVTCLFTLFYTLCVPYPASEEFSYPLYRLAALANSSVVFQRLDGLVFIIWMFAGFISVGALTLFGIMIFARIFNLKDLRALAAAFTMLVFFIALGNVADTQLVRSCMSVYTFSVLIITSLIYRFKYRWRRKNA